MLTKFQNLKDKKRSIFIVATNYEDRIDSAIKRQGRFDDRLLLSLPDRTRRQEFLWGFLSEKLADLRNAPNWDEYVAKAQGGAKRIVDAAKKEKDDILRDSRVRRQFDSVADLDAVLKRTYWFGYGDLKHLVQNVLKIRPGDTWKSIGEGLLSGSEGVQPAVKLNAYVSRFEGVRRNEQVPSEEFALLVYLVGECGARLTPAAADVVEQIFKLKPLKEMLEELPVSNPEVRNVVRQAFVEAAATNSGKASSVRSTKRRRSRQ